MTRVAQLSERERERERCGSVSSCRWDVSSEGDGGMERAGYRGYHRAAGPVGEGCLQQHHEEAGVFLTRVVSLQVGTHQQHRLPAVQLQGGC